MIELTGSSDTLKSQSLICPLELKRVNREHAYLLGHSWKGWVHGRQVARSHDDTCTLCGLEWYQLLHQYPNAPPTDPHPCRPSHRECEPSSRRQQSSLPPIHKTCPLLTRFPPNTIFTSRKRYFILAVSSNSFLLPKRERAWSWMAWTSEHFFGSPGAMSDPRQFKNSLHIFLSPLNFRLCMLRSNR